MKKAVSLAEVMVSIIILALSVTGIITVFYTARNYIARTEKRSAATSLSHSNLRVLPQAVRADTWDTGGLSTGTKSLSPSEIGIHSYSGGYQVDSVDHPFITGIEDYRQVEIRITYPD